MVHCASPCDTSSPMSCGPAAWRVKAPVGAAGWYVGQLSVFGIILINLRCDDKEKELPRQGAKMASVASAGAADDAPGVGRIPLTRRARISLSCCGRYDATHPEEATPAAPLRSTT